MIRQTGKLTGNEHGNHADHLLIALLVNRMNRRKFKNPVSVGPIGLDLTNLEC